MKKVSVIRKTELSEKEKMDALRRLFDQLQSDLCAIKEKLQYEK